MLTKQMAAEWAAYGIRVNSVSPGLIHTPLTEDIYNDEEMRVVRESLVSLKRIGTSKDVSDVILFLASAKSAYMTGQSLIVDGGLLGTIQQHLAGRPKSKT
ncbi:dehydrogenase [Geomicrobium sp. JCM 19037]|nr:dehydrogenase [Geomicrobium sp. JCM 19037]